MLDCIHVEFYSELGYCLKERLNIICILNNVKIW